MTIEAPPSQNTIPDKTRWFRLGLHGIGNGRNEPQTAVQDKRM